MGDDARGRMCPGDNRPTAGRRLSGGYDDNPRHRNGRAVGLGRAIKYLVSGRAGGRADTDFLADQTANRSRDFSVGRPVERALSSHGRRAVQGHADARKNDGASDKSYC